MRVIRPDRIYKREDTNRDDLLVTKNRKIVFWHPDSSFALQGGITPLISRPNDVDNMSIFASNKLKQLMKFALAAIVASVFASSCCPSAAPAPSKPAYVAPSK
jgi:hypothetical protein